MNVTSTVAVVPRASLLWKPWPRLTAPHSVARADMTVKMVVPTAGRRLVSVGVRGVIGAAVVVVGASDIASLRSRASASTKPMMGTTMQLAINVRNKALGAYKDIMNMPV